MRTCARVPELFTLWLLELWVDRDEVARGSLPARDLVADSEGQDPQLSPCIDLHFDDLGVNACVRPAGVTGLYELVDYPDLYGGAVADVEQLLDSKGLVDLEFYQDRLLGHPVGDADDVEVAVSGLARLEEAELDHAVPCHSGRGQLSFEDGFVLLGIPPDVLLRVAVSFGAGKDDRTHPPQGVELFGVHAGAPANLETPSTSIAHQSFDRFCCQFQFNFLHSTGCRQLKLAKFRQNVNRPLTNRAIFYRLKPCYD